MTLADMQFGGGTDVRFSFGFGLSLGGHASQKPNPVATTNYKKIKAPIRAVQTVHGDMIQGVPQREALALIMVASKTDI